MAGEKQPFLVFWGLWKIQFPPGHVYCPTFSHLSLYFLCIPSRMQDRTLFLVWSITSIKIKWGIAHWSQHLLLLELVSSVVQYIYFCHIDPCISLSSRSYHFSILSSQDQPSCLPTLTNILFFAVILQKSFHLFVIFLHSPIFQLSAYLSFGCSSLFIFELSRCII